MDPNAPSNVTQDQSPEEDKIIRCIYSTVNIHTMSTINLIYFIFYIPIYPVTVFFGMLGNTLALVVLGAEKPYTSTSFLLQSLAVADNLFLLFRIMYITFPRFYFYFGLWVEFRAFYAFALRYITMGLWFAKTCSVYITVCVAAERYVAVCRPLKAATLCTMRNARIAVLCVVAFAFVYRLPYLFPYTVTWLFDPCSGEYKPRFGRNAMYYNIYYRIIYTTSLHFILMSAIPIACLVFLTLSLLMALKKAVKNVNLTASGGRSTENVKATTIRVVSVVIVFIFLELPGSLLQFVGILQTYASVAVTFNAFQISLMVSYFLGVVNSFCNFYIYCLTGRRFRMTLGQVVRCRVRKALSSNTDN